MFDELKRKNAEAKARAEERKQQKQKEAQEFAEKQRVLERQQLLTLTEKELLAELVIEVRTLNARLSAIETKVDNIKSSAEESANYQLMNMIK